MSSGYYLIAAPLQVTSSRYQDNVIVFAKPGTDSVSLSIIYVGTSGFRGLYYDADSDEFAFNLIWQEYSPSTVARHINSALGSNFAGGEIMRIGSVDITKDDILGKLVPAEP